MSNVTINRFRWVTLPMALALIVGAGQLAGQDRESARPAAKAEKKERSAGRLPAYYSQVVTKEQREKIYAVQAKYADEIEKLLEQVGTLEKNQIEEIEAVLSQEQLDQVMKLASEAKSKRSKKTEKISDADAGK